MFGTKPDLSSQVAAPPLLDVVPQPRTLELCTPWLSWFLGPWQSISTRRVRNSLLGTANRPECSSSILHSSPTASNSTPILSDLVQGQAGKGNTKPEDDLHSSATANAPSSVPSCNPGHHGGQGWCHGQYLHCCWRDPWSKGSKMRFVQGARAGSPAYFNKMELSAMP